MSYQVLARKWRPQLFEDVVGQGHITRTLQNAISSDRLAHAFLFSGPRGVGKTTTARILAKALNCSEGPTPRPCGKCDSCLEIASGASVDVVEIDGASNRGIEHVRELREAVRYAPARGKHKVYVIDEVHMLTNEAFNALLKTLEEPPPHVIFIFATTEPQKIPATIHSRCQRYGFKRIPLHEIVAKLRDIADKEGITISDEGLAVIGRAAEGSMRDSQSLLDQAVSFSGMKIGDDDLKIMHGAVSQETLIRFTEGLIARDPGGLLNQVDELLEQGQDMRQFLNSALEHIRNIIIAKTAADPGKIIELPPSDVEAVKRQAAGTEMERMILLFDGLSRTFEEMRWSQHQRFTLEIGIVKACSLAPLKPLVEVLERIKDFESRLGAGCEAARPQTEAVGEKPAIYRPQKPQGDLKQPKALPEERASGDFWNRIVSEVKKKKPGLGSCLDRSKVVEDNKDGIVVGIRTGFDMNQVEKKENRDIIEQVVAEAMGKAVRVTFQLIGEEPGRKPSKTAETKKPAHKEQDPVIQNVLNVFGGEVIDDDAQRS